MMEACLNCGEKIEGNIEICPNCGAYIHEEEEITDSNTELKEDIVENDTFGGPLDLNEAVDNLPDETFSDDEIEKRALDVERRKFGKSSE